MQDGGEVLVRFHDTNGSGAIGRVDLAVVIERDGEVVHARFDAIVLPGSARIAGGIHLKAEAVHIGEDAVGSVVVVETRRPYALPGPSGGPTGIGSS